MRRRAVALLILLYLACSTAGAGPLYLRGEARDWPKTSHVGWDEAGDARAADVDLCNLFYVEAGGRLHFRFTTVAPISEGITYSIEVRQTGSQNKLTIGQESPELDDYRSGCMVELAVPRPMNFNGIQGAAVRLFDQNLVGVLDTAGFDPHAD